MDYLQMINDDKNDISEYFKSDPLLFYHLKKTKVNLDKIKNQPNFRAYKDESTSAFVNEFFLNEDTLSYFIFYNFHILHYYIISNINKELEKFNEIIKSNEEIFVIFKGGNIIHFYFNKIFYIRFFLYLFLLRHTTWTKKVCAIRFRFGKKRNKTKFAECMPTRK